MSTHQSTPGLVNWVGYLAITLLVTLPLAVLTVRSGAWQQGLLVYAISCLGAAVLLLLVALLMALPKFAPWRGALAKRAIFALPGALLLLSMLGGGNYPAIHDISTDTEDPPVFVAAPKQRGDGSNSLDIEPATLEAQKAAYTDLDTLVTPASIEDAFIRAKETSLALGWDIYHEDLSAGIIEAVDTTRIMGFQDDVVIRLRTNADGTLIDLRSVSRVGVSDLGANAARIRRFVEAFPG
ncbi:DUF1499 domain-containing protein [Pseudohalioglobus lutimaris]|uniref:DUF1499 domain-containing protein n=1 Tax=Pseudohalioglobus lutimaris TaxID=1737061 RepID=A0A2N5X751_9GAMM|nr:DUF1499 domain-containing protein [Pseudohalioglobus lutimaris]PLW70309.1 DUF1499 domain-containing protein [Pseudohalioglobus lutimaris]